MSYEIPPPLQHKEKIIFGLTFQQLAVATPSFLVCVLLLKFGSLTVAIPLISLVFTIAVFMVLFDGVNKILHFIKHIRTQEVDVNSSSLKELVDIKKIKDDVVQSKQKLAILEIIPLNFLIKNEDEQESIITGFQKFLNSLDFPIQIHISSDDISLDEHFKSLEKRTKKFPELYESYCKFIKKSISDNNVKNRKFYVIITEKDDIEIQAKVCEEKLRSLGLRVIRLNDAKLLGLFFDYVAHNKQKVIAEGQVIENYTHFLLSPEKIVFSHDHFVVDDLYCKVLTVTGYPHSVEMGFLDKIISSGENYDISVHIEPFPIEDTLIQLNRELQKQQADLYAEKSKGIYNPSLEIKFNSTKKVLQDLQKGKQKLFNVSLYVLCKGKNKKEAELLSKKIKADLEGLMIQSKTPLFQMQTAYESLLPVGRDSLKVKRNIHTKGLSAFFPFSSPFLDVENEGILLGLNKNGIPYIKDIFQLTNQNGIVLATSGGGKSYFTKLMISRQHMNGCGVIIIDPQGEYLAITEHYGGETITISKNSETMINPLDLMGHEYLEKRLSLMDLFKIMFGDLTEIQKAILDKAVDLTYARKGINRDKWKAVKPPKLQDLYQVLKNLERECAQQEKVTYRALLNRLGMYTENGVFSFLNKDTNINFSNDFVCFNIGNMPKQVKPVVMYLVLDYVYQRMKKSLNRKILVIDEAWAMLQTAEDSSYIFEIVKTCRKYNMGLLMITQDVADLVASKAGHAVLANTSYTMLLRQKPAIINSVAKTFNLSQNEKEFLVTATAGNGILILENEHQELKVISSDKEHELVTTNPDEMMAKGEKKKGRVSVSEDVSIGLDIEQDVYAVDGLNIEERNFLTNNGYVIGNFYELDQKRHAKYFVKIRKPESALHTYYVDALFNEVKLYTEKVEKHRTVNADLVFTNKVGEEIAIEIETGINVKYKKRYHNGKFLQRKKEFGNRCYVFLPKARLENSYRRHGLPILFRLQSKEFIKEQFSGKSNSIIVEKLSVTNEEFST